MSKVKLTMSLTEEVATYLRSAPSASAIVAEAVRLYRTHKLEEELERAYREDAREAEAINRLWEPVEGRRASTAGG